MKNYILCSADETYFYNYAPSLIKSAQLVGMEVIIDCINFHPNSESYSLREKIKKWALDRNYNLWFNDTTFPFNEGENKKVKYSCGRINALIRSMENDVCEGVVNSYMANDIDSLVQRYFKFPVSQTKGLSFYFRDPIAHGANSDWEKRGMKLLGTFFVTTKMLPYLKRVKLRIENSNQIWFIDQVALYETMTQQDLTESDDFSQSNILGWDIENYDKFAVLTGKGQRKFLKEYKQIQEKYSREIYSEIMHLS